jgi:vacuolar-type H+-ATPase subunit F/Vma7
MTKYSAELSKIEESQQRTAQFYKVAFHCHSPLSHDWGKNKGDSTLNGKEQYLPTNKESAFYKLIQDRSDCDVVIITDHMKCGYAERLANHSSEQSGLVILPGMEISVRTNPVLGEVRVHVIVIMPPGSNPETFAPLLSGLSIESERTGKEEVGIDDFTLRAFAKEPLCEELEHNWVCPAHMPKQQRLPNCQVASPLRKFNQRAVKSLAFKSPT